MDRRHFIAATTSLVLLPVIPSKAETPLDRVKSKLGEVGFVRDRGNLFDDERFGFCRVFVITETPFNDWSEFRGHVKDGKNYAMYAWFEGDDEVDVPLVRQAFEMPGKYTNGGKPGSGPYGGYDFLSRNENIG